MKNATKIVSVFLAATMIFTTFTPQMIKNVSAVVTTPGAVVINAADYGADPSGKTDSALPIWNAFEAAKKATADGATSVTVDFPKGEYHIFKDFAQKRVYHTSNTDSTTYPTKIIGILIENQTNFTLEGNGSLFMMEGNIMSLAVVKSKNVKLHNFSWDFTVPTASEMTVTKMGTMDGKDYVDYYIPSCSPWSVDGTTIRWDSQRSPYTGELYWTERGRHNSLSTVAHSPEWETSKSYLNSQGVFESVASIEKLSDNTVRFKYNNRNDGQKKPIELGAVFQFVSSAKRETAGAFLWESSDILIEKINVHYMHGFGWLTQMSNNVYYKNCNFSSRQGTGRYAMSFADGLHASGASGYFKIEGCNFANSHDDPINMHGTFTRVEQRIDNNTLKLKYIHGQQGGFPQYHIGDKVVFYARDTLTSTDSETQYTVSEVTNPGESGNDLKTSIVKFTEALPTTLSETIGSEPKYVAENITYAPAVTIKNNTFKHVSTRGILCTTRNKVLIENNLFLHMNYASIFLSNDADQWYESGPIRDMTIRNNTFFIREKQRFASSNDEVPAILIRPITKGGAMPPASTPIHKNIIIDRNTFYMNEDNVVNATSVENLQITNNKILRYNNDVNITIAAAQTTIQPNTTTTLTTNSTGRQNTGNRENMYEFNKCKDVLVSGNTYDDGLKLYAVVPDQATKDTLTVNDTQITVVGDRGRAAKPAVSNIKYTTTDPLIATVDQQGVITAHKNGTVKVFAFYEWNGTAIKSNEVTLTVSDSGTPVPTTFSINGNDNVKLTAVDQTHVFTTAVTPTDFTGSVVWSIVDAKTGEVTTDATISTTGTLTAKSSGVVTVKATLAGKVATKTVIISIPQSKTVSPSFEIKREDAAKWTSKDAGKSAEITMQIGDLFNAGNNAKNVFLYTIPTSIPKDNMRATIEITGLPARVAANNVYDSVSFLLYKDDDNYVSLGKKSHMNGITRVNEKSGTATETAGNAAQDAVTTATLSIYKNGNTISTAIKVGSGEWVDCGNITDATIGNDYKVGFATWGNNLKIKFSNLRVANGSTTTNDTILSTESVNIVGTANSEPVVTNATVTTATVSGKEVATVAYTYTDADNNLESGTVYKWSYTQNGQAKDTFTSTKTFETKSAGALVCTVYPMDTSSAVGTPVSANTTVTGNIGSDVVFTAKDNYTALTALRIPELSVNETTFTHDTHIEVPTNKKQVTIEIVGSDRTGNVTLDHGDIRTPVNLTKTGNVFSTTVSLGSGLDSYFIESIAKDGITTERYRIHFIRVASPNADATNITIGGTAIAGFVPATTEYSYDMPASMTTLPLAVTLGDSANATSAITVNGKKRYEGTSKTLTRTDLQQGLNTIVISVKADNLVTNKFYTLNVMVSATTNAKLLNLEVVDKVMTPAFNQNITSYELTTGTQNITINATAQEVGSKITVSSRDVNNTSTTNTITQNINVYKGNNVISVKVVAPDGLTEKIYIINVDVTGNIYLSDLDWDTSSTTGFGSITRDLSVASSPLKLATKPNAEDNTGAPATYAKGIGVNADSTLIYNITGKGFTRFKAYVGVDYANYNATYGSVTFKVFLNDSTTAIFDSGEMTQKTPQKTIDIDVTGMNKITLKALKGANNFNDHADWADAKFTSTVAEAAVTNAALVKAINDAQAKYNTAVEGDDLGKYEVGSKAVYQTAIDLANTKKTATTQLEINDAIIALATATNTFESKKVVTTIVDPVALMPGDINADTKFDISDALYALKVVTTTIEQPTGNRLTNGNLVSSNIIIDKADTELLLKHIIDGTTPH